MVILGVGVDFAISAAILFRFASAAAISSAVSATTAVLPNEEGTSTNPSIALSPFFVLSKITDQQCDRLSNKVEVRKTGLACAFASSSLQVDGILVSFKLSRYDLITSFFSSMICSFSFFLHHKLPAAYQPLPDKMLPAHLLC